MIQFLETWGYTLLYVLRYVFFYATGIRIPLMPVSAAKQKYASKEFMDHMDAIYDEYARNFEPGSYNGSRFNYSRSARSFSHFLYTIASYYDVKRIYEIGTFRGGSVMMLMNFFVDRAIHDFFIRTIDIHRSFSPLNFNQRTRDRHSAHERNIQVVIGDSGKESLENPFDLAIIDGSHRPSQLKKDFEALRRQPTLVFFDDLHMYGDLKHYERLIVEQGYHEIFRMFTSDCDGTDPHLVALAEKIERN